MCGRFTLGATAADLAAQFDLTPVPAWTPRYNIAPSQVVPAVIQNQESAARVFRPLRWGLVPSWAKDPAIRDRMINARADRYGHLSTPLERPLSHAAW